MIVVAAPCVAQDVIVNKDGSTILSKIIEVNSSDIKYKKFSNLDGPTYTINKSDVVSVNYENGDRDDFKESTSDDTHSVTNKIITLRAGTPIPIEIVNSVRASNLDRGSRVAFRVSRDVVVDGVTILPYGTPVTGVVYKASRSSVFGTKGKLGIKIENVYTKEGVKIPLKNGDIYVTGTNRTTLSVLLFLFVTWPACFICGSRAEIPNGYEIVAYVSAPVDLNTNGSTTQSIFPRYGIMETVDGEIISALITAMDDAVITYKLKNVENGEETQISVSKVKKITVEK